MTLRHLFFLSFFGGVALGTTWRFGFVSVFFLAALGFVFCLLVWWRSASGRRARSGLLLAVAIFCLALALGAGRGLVALGPVERPLDHFLGQSVELTGAISDEPDEREKSTRLTFAPDNLVEKIILVSSKYPEHFYGERLRVAGQLEQPQNFQTNAGREFDYQSYLAKDDVYYLINQPRLESVGRVDDWFTRAQGSLFAFKNLFLTRLGQVLPEPQASLLAGIVIGAKRGLPSDWQERFRAVGLSHIIVLSGYNITIVAEAVRKLLSFLPALAGTSGGAVAILLFTLATGASTTAVRAAIMALVALLARATGRIYQSLDALFLAAFLMILFKPKILLFDISFQLSFLATLGVILGPPFFERYLQRVPTRFGLREMTATTISAQLLVLPWILYKMGQLSLVALPANLLVLAFVPLTMLLGFLTFIFPPLGYVSYLFLAYDLGVVKVFSALPFAAVNLPYFPFWLVVLVYLGYAGCYKFRNETPAPRPLSPR